MPSSHVIVDGSNIATEGRTEPSLRQLDEAVRAFLDQHPHDKLTVVVDATFQHRIAKSERDTFESAILAGEMVTPPAGAIGRGDAFVLEIAERTGARLHLQHLSSAGAVDLLQQAKAQGVRVTAEVHVAAHVHVSVVMSSAQRRNQ